MISPAMSDVTLQYPPDLLAEALRELLDASPSDQVQGLPAGSLRVERSWLPFYPLEATNEIVLSVICGDDSGKKISRNCQTADEIEIGFSVQKKLDHDPITDLGKAEIREVAHFAHRCLIAAFVPVIDSRGISHSPQQFQRSFIDETLASWNQVSITFLVTYKTV